MPPLLLGPSDDNGDDNKYDEDGADNGDEEDLSDGYSFPSFDYSGIDDEYVSPSLPEDGGKPRESLKDFNRSDII